MGGIVGISRIFKGMGVYIRWVERALGGDEFLSGYHGLRRTSWIVLNEFSRWLHNNLVGLHKKTGHQSLPKPHFSSLN
jgi:hypothetical protein